MRGWSHHVPMAPWEHSLQGLLFLLITVCSLHVVWQVHGGNPFEFLRHGSDPLGYYQWLPSAFIDHDMSKMYWAHPMLNGRSLSMFTLGVALMELPFFLLGHWAAWSFGYPMDGFSAPYGVAIMVGCSLYAGAGCVVAFKLARRYSNTLVALLATVVLFAGTNLLRYCAFEPTMSHLFSFLLIGVYAWCGSRVIDGPKAYHVFLLILSGSLLLLVRQTNGLVLFFPLLVAGSREGLVAFFRHLLMHRMVLIGGLVVGVVPWVLQMIYWHFITGQWVIFTYGVKDEGFSLQKIAPGLVLFSVRNGWLVYTPLMLAVLAMLLRRSWQGVRPARSILFLTVITLLVYSAWWCWWLGASYGHRGLVDLYALLVIPLAWLMAWVQSRPLVLKTWCTVILLALLFLNLALVQRYDWWWSTEAWTWQYLFEQLGEIATFR